MQTMISELMKPITITEEENDEYIVLLERLTAYHSLHLGLEDHPELMAEVGLSKAPSSRELYRQTYRAFSKWWQRMDEKYMLVHDENSLLLVDVHKRMIFSQPKDQQAQ